MENEDKVVALDGSEYERRINTIKPGMLFLLQFTSFTDDEFIDDTKEEYSTKELRREKIDDILSKAVKMPAVIISKKYDNDFPVYDVGFWTKSRYGEQSGMITIKDMCVWRYFGGDEINPEGLPPKWIKNTLSNYEIDETLKELELFYIEDNKEIKLTR